jgi:hypothetical protein
MNLLMAVSASVVGAMLLAWGTLLWVRLSGYRGAPSSDAPQTELTASDYRPMARLMSEEDLDFLRQFAGCRPQLAARWERERRRIFRLYLREAAADFRRMHAEARLLLAGAPEQYSDLVGVLMRQQVTFWRTLSVIETRLALNTLGLGKIDGSRIAALIEAMRAEVNRSVTPVSA